jgi:hypothetical protein
MGRLTTYGIFYPIARAVSLGFVEMLDGARMLSEWLDPEKNYDLPDLQDAANKIASNEAEDYYAVINQRVQDLALWAYDEVDELVQELFPHSVSDQPPT